jgi:hypothetical protein
MYIHRTGTNIRTLQFAYNLTDINSIEVRIGWKIYYLMGILAWIAFVSIGFVVAEQQQGIIDLYFSKWSFAELPVFVMLVAWLSICLYYYFDNRVKARIDGNGIWSKKSGSLSWDDIWYFNSTVYKSRNQANSYTLHVKLKDTEERLNKEAALVFHGMDKSFDEIRAVVEYYAVKYQILDLGHESEC